MSIYEQKPGIRDPVVRELRRAQCKAWIVVREDGSLAGAGIEQNVGMQAGAFAVTNEMCLDVTGTKFSFLHVSGGIISDGTNVSRRKPPSAAGNQSASDLATRRDADRIALEFGVGRGETRKFQDNVRGI